jgi:hypothetical protein
MQTNAERTSSARDLPMDPLPARATAQSFVSLLVLVVVLVLIAMIVWPR